MNGIQPDDRIDRFQIPFTPSLYLGEQLVGYGIDSTVGKLHPIEIGNVTSNILVAVTQGKRGNDLALPLISEMSLVFFDKLGFESAGPISGCIQLKAASRAFHCLGRLAIPAIGRLFIGQVFIQLRCHSGFGELFDQRCQDAILTCEILAFTQGFEGGFHIESWVGHRSSLLY